MSEDAKIETTIEMDDGYLIVTDQHPDDFEFVSDCDCWMAYFVKIIDNLGREIHLNPSHITRMVVHYV